MSPTLHSIPEELLENILSLAIFSQIPLPKATAQPTRKLGHACTRLAPLLVSRTFLRIATPACYRYVILLTGTQASALAAVLRANPKLGTWVREVRIDGTFGAFGDVVKYCPHIASLDVIVDDRPASHPVGTGNDSAPAQDSDPASFCDVLGKMSGIKHVVLRKDTFSSQLGTKTLELLSTVIPKWEKLETINIDFKVSPSPAAHSLAAALAKAPSLRVLSTSLPSIWSTCLLEVSANPNLKRIHLTPYRDLNVGTHLFLSQARNHQRLFTLIRAGTPIPRPRARTIPGRRIASTPVAPSTELKNESQDISCRLEDESAAIAESSSAPSTSSTAVAQ